VSLCVNHGWQSADLDRLSIALHLPLHRPFQLGREDAADWIRRLRELALKDEEGKALDGGIQTLRTL